MDNNITMDTHDDDDWEPFPENFVPSPQRFVSTKKALPPPNAAGAGAGAGGPEDDGLTWWLSTIELSKPKKNLARDFSDGVLMAELIAHFYPRMVDLHNYAHVTGPTLKMKNWEVLNRKVLPKLEIKLPISTMVSICLAKPGFIEPILRQIRKLINRKVDRDELARRNGEDVPVLEDITCKGHMKDEPNHDGVPDYVIYRDIKYVPEQLLMDKQKDITKSQAKYAELCNKVKRLEIFMQLKESHLKDLTAQVHEYRVKLGIVTEETGFKDDIMTDYEGE